MSTIVIMIVIMIMMVIVVISTINLSWTNSELFNSLKKGETESKELKYRNADDAQDIENLIDLPILNEAEFLYNLKKRYASDIIYTYTGPILIAINPYDTIKSAAAEPIIKKFIEDIKFEACLFDSEKGGNSITKEEAFRRSINLERASSNSKSFYDKGGKKKSFTMKASESHHSILISGEIGAGKTECSKVVLKGLMEGDGEAFIKEKILQSNHILEAFGNAQTTRNDNNSRFSKYCEVSFDNQGVLVGGTIRTYLLDHGRVSKLTTHGERNFHIFYQLVAGANAEECSAWQIDRNSDYRYLTKDLSGQGANEEDRWNFVALKGHFVAMNFDAQEMLLIFELLAGILHMGQIEFIATSDNTGDGCKVSEQSIDSLDTAATLLGFDPDTMEKAMTGRTVISGGERFYKKFNSATASNTRDTLAKVMYKNLFDWVVHKINLMISEDTSPSNSTIGILDIFGFENFEHNSLEQLCNNYANEALQQQFNQFIFKREIIEYQNEKINYGSIEFPDNQDSLDLIGLSIFHLIDDQCRIPNPNDKRLMSQLYKDLRPHKKFSCNATQQSANKFEIHHFSGKVEYCGDGFIEKNLDEMPNDAKQLLFTSANIVVTYTGGEENPSEGSAPAPKRRGSTIGAISSVVTQYKNQVSYLMKMVNSTESHYIRCIKPFDAAEEVLTPVEPSAPTKLTKTNSNASSMRMRTVSMRRQAASVLFNGIRVVEQLQNSGVLEAVRVSRSGFPVRLSHFDFYFRYRHIANPFNPVLQTLPSFISDDTSSDKTMEYCNKLIVVLTEESKQQQVQAGPSSSMRNSMTRVSSRRVSDVQSALSKEGKNYILEPLIHLGLTKVFLRKADHDLLETIRYKFYLASVHLIQSRYRGHQQLKSYSKIKVAAALINRVARGRKGRRAAWYLRRAVTAVYLQKLYPLFRDRGRFIAMRRAIWTLQRRYHFRKVVYAMLKEFSKTRKGFVILQSLQRKKMAIRYAEMMKNKIAYFHSGIVTPKARMPADPVERISFYNEEDEVLIAAMMSLTNKKQISKMDALLHFNVKESAKNLRFWAISMSDGPLKKATFELAHTVDYAYNLLFVDAIIPQTTLEKVLHLGCETKTENRTISARKANGNISKDHEIFCFIYKNMDRLKVMIKLCEREIYTIDINIKSRNEKHAEYLRQYGANYQRNYGDIFKQDIAKLNSLVDICTKVFQFSKILYLYYYEYIRLFVLEYGPDSEFRLNFVEDSEYLIKLTLLIKQRQPLLSDEKRILGINADHKDIIEDKTISQSKKAKEKAERPPPVNPAEKARKLLSAEGVNFQYMPYAPGIEWAFNTLYRLLMEAAVHPTRLLRLTGKSASNYGNQHYYQASPVFTDVTLEDMFRSPRDLQLLDYEGMSSLLLTSVLTGLGSSGPGNFMVKYHPNEDPEGMKNMPIKSVEVVAMQSDEALAHDIFRSRFQPGAMTKLTNSGLNLLFFFPHMDDIVDDRVKDILTKSMATPEKIVSAWLRELYQQNLRCKGLLSSGFKHEDMEKLHLPIRLPAGTAVSIFEKLRVLYDLLSQNDDLTHSDVLRMFYPITGEYFEEKRASCLEEEDEFTFLYELYSIATEEELGKRAPQTADELNHRLSQGLHHESAKTPAKEEMSMKTPSRSAKLDRQQSRVYSKYVSSKSIEIKYDMIYEFPTASDDRVLIQNENQKNLMKVSRRIFHTPSYVDKVPLINKPIRQKPTRLNARKPIDTRYNLVNDETQFKDNLKRNTRNDGAMTNPMARKSDDSVNPMKNAGNRNKVIDDYGITATDDEEMWSMSSKYEKATSVMRQFSSQQSKEFDFNEIYNYGASSDERDHNISMYNEFQDGEHKPAKTREKKERAEMMERVLGLAGENPEIAEYLEALNGNKSKMAIFNTSIENLALELLFKIDFSEEYIIMDDTICRTLGDNLYFIPVMILQNISADQLQAMYGGWIELAKQRRNRSMLSRLVTKHLILMGNDESTERALRVSPILQDLKRLLKIRVHFDDEDSDSDGEDDEEEEFFEVFEEETEETDLAQGQDFDVIRNRLSVDTQRMSELATREYLKKNKTRNLYNSSGSGKSVSRKLEGVLETASEEEQVDADADDEGEGKVNEGVAEWKQSADSNDRVSRRENDQTLQRVLSMSVPLVRNATGHKEGSSSSFYSPRLPAPDISNKSGSFYNYYFNNETKSNTLKKTSSVLSRKMVSRSMESRPLPADPVSKGFNGDRSSETIRDGEAMRASNDSNVTYNVDRAISDLGISTINGGDNCDSPHESPKARSGFGYSYSREDSKRRIAAAVSLRSRMKDDEDMKEADDGTVLPFKPLPHEQASAWGAEVAAAAAAAAAAADDDAPYKPLRHEDAPDWGAQIAASAAIAAAAAEEESPKRKTKKTKSQTMRL